MIFMDRSKAAQERKPATSIVVLAFNEGRNLETTIESIHKAVIDILDTYEVIIVNDGSSDDTGKVAIAIAGQDARIKVIHNSTNMGCGFSFERGVQAAGYPYVWLIPGDGEIPDASISTIANHIGTADMVIPYMLNFEIRPLSRRIVSWGYTSLINVLFIKNLHYYNGPCVVRTDLARSKRIINTRGFVFMAPLLLRLIRENHSYVEVGISLQPRVFGTPSISSLFNILSAARRVSRLFWDMNVAERFTSAQAKYP